jgi:hypothetical protein
MNKKHGLRIGIALFVLAAMFTLAGCEGLAPDTGSKGGDTLEGTVTANVDGLVEFSYDGYSYTGGVSSTCSVTTDLPAPDDTFTLSDDKKYISGLTPGQIVTWEAAIEEGEMYLVQGTYDHQVSITGGSR